MTAPVPPGDPLATNSDGVPLLYPALGAVLHLEPLGPEDEPRLEAVSEIVWNWFGSELRWVSSSFEPVVRRARREDAEYVSGYVTELDVPEGDSSLEQALFTGHAQFVKDDFEVAFSGGATEIGASPYSYRFWAEVPDPSPGRVRSFGVIHITVPEAWPTEDFVMRVSAVAGALRVRWGAAGYTFSPWILSDYEMPSVRVAAHARRHPGYDVAEYTRLVKAFHRRIRTVSWLTILGSSIAEELARAGRVVEPSSHLTVGRAGECLVVRAGARPEKGDANRLVYPPAYVEADALLRPIRASSGEGMTFLGPWDERQITDWLRRFEKRVN
jgi:hypothetical protein